jgi:thymidylate synthase
MEGRFADSLGRMRVRGADGALAGVLEAVLNQGLTVAAGRRYTECWNLAVELAEPRRRIVENPAVHFDPISAIARFVWLVAGSDRVVDIAHYEPRVENYSDDHLSVPGSNYGMRLFAPHPGIDQIAGIIGRLREDPHTRRASGVIWQPEDAVRPSKDIPCAFGLHFHIREGHLHSTIQMRSNNAVTLLGFNLFEFTLLAEVIAAEVGVELGRHIHTAASMHVYEDERSRAEEIIRAYRPEAPGLEMPPIGPGALEQARRLARHEAELRHAAAELADSSLRDLRARAGDLDDHFRALYRVLLAFAVDRAGQAEAADELVEFVPAYLRGHVASSLAFRRSRRTEGQLALPIGGGPALRVAEALAADPYVDDLERKIAALPDSHGVTFSEGLELRQRLSEGIAARGSEPIDDKRILEELGRLRHERAT